MQKINLKELARQLNLSIATVSKALRDSHEISTKTKAFVLEAATRLHYTPNPYASSLRRKKSKTIAVIIPEVADSFFSLAINGIQSIAELKDYHILIYLTHEKFEIEQSIVAACGNGRVDGVLISISKETCTSDHFAALQSENIPLIFFDREFENFDTAMVLTNDFECGRLAAEHLAESYCKKPVFLSASGTLPMCNKRAQGFVEGLKIANLWSAVVDPILICNGSDAENYQQITAIISGPDRPDGIVTSVEKLGMQVYLACQERGIQIPEQIKVIAFSTVETAPILNPSLTTITQPAFNIGRTAAEILFKAIDKPNYNYAKECIVLPSQLVKRNSTGI